MLDQTLSPALASKAVASMAKSLPGSELERPGQWRVPGVGQARPRHTQAQTARTPAPASFIFPFATFERTCLVPRPLSKPH